MGAFNIIRENLRRAATGDDKYFRKWLMFFELQIPAEVSPTPDNKFLFPLVIPPEAYELGEPFAAEVTPTQAGGLFVEENGIIQRNIRLEGTTGFKPRKMRGRTSQLLATSPDVRSYTRSLPPFTWDDLSGHSHFMYLQDAVFRTYADLKRDPATADGTKLYFHVPKDDEHWRVIPQKFDLKRGKGERTMYRYSIELLVVDKAHTLENTFSEEVGLFGAIKNLLRAVQAAIDLVSGAIQDLTALIDEIKRFVKNIATILDTIAGVIDAATNFVAGLTELIESPYAVIEGLIGQVEAAQELVAAAEELGDVQFSATVSNKLRQLVDGLEILGVHPEAFLLATQAAIRGTANESQLSQSVNQTTLDQAAAGTSPTTFAQTDALGTALTPGDVQSAKANLSTSGTARAYTGLRAVVIARGDTLSNLAARYLRDARRWQEIAVVNGLKPPYLPGQEDAPIGVATLGGDQMLRVGEQIMVPTFGRPTMQQTAVAVLGARPDDPVETRLLGRDLKLVVVGGRPGADLLDLEIDRDRGSVGPVVLSGLDCLAQDLRTRMTTDRGSDILYKGLGMERVIGLAGDLATLEIAKFRAGQAITQDPRVASIRTLNFSVDQDIVNVDGRVEVRGLDEPLAIQVAA